MVAELLRLRLQTIANTVRFGPRALLTAVVSVLLVLLASSAVSALAGGLRGRRSTTSAPSWWVRAR
nr:hypothetical protein GCM10025699_59800 [Microbacterium flavescens]